MGARVMITFPRGSLLRGLLHGDPGLLTGLGELAAGETALEILLSAGALAENGWTLEAGRERVAAVLEDVGAKVEGARILGPPDLHSCQTTWAKRLAFGRDPRAVRLEALLRRREAATYRNAE